MKTILTLTAISMACLNTPVLADSFNAGLTDLTVKDQEGSRHLEGFVWYPTKDANGQEMHHTNAVWEGAMASQNAEPAMGQYPLLVLSHGMFGNAMNQSWLAAEFTQAGYIVASISHPGTSTWARDPDDRRKLWERPRDISRVIDHLTADPQFSSLIDTDRIFMAGHSLGGFTAIALAGGRYDAPKMDAFCDANSGEMVCGIFQGWNIAKTPDDRAAMSADLSDPRIRGFGVLDLGGTQTFSLESLGSIDTPMLVYGAPLNVSGLDLDIESRALVAALPEGIATYKEPSTLSHFDFLGVCKTGAIEILKSEEPGDEIICADGGETRRGEHDVIAKEMIAFFGAL